ncbi:MAG: LytTR family DNA-binding domain-containing protein [Cyclobacteriaceae bacterium]
MEPGVLRKHGFFPTKDGAVKIPCEHIEYLLASGQYCDIFLKDGTKYNTSYPMKEVLKKIPDENIVRISRSSCINLKAIESIDGNLVRIGSNTFTIGETYRDEVKSLFNLF